MKALYVFLAIVLGFGLASCTNEMEEGKGYPFLEMGDRTVVYAVDQVMQNDTDVKPYLGLFDGISLTISYENNKPSKLTFAETDAPFSVVGGKSYVDVDWEINTASTPYEIRVKGTGELICYMTRDRMISFPFKLGAPSNKYEYRMLPQPEAE